MIVYKFGGASLAGPAEVLESCRIIEREAGTSRLAVVVSAMKGVTEGLLRAVELAASGDRLGCTEVLEEIDERHLDVASVLMDDPREGHAYIEIHRGLLCRLDEICRAVGALGEATPRVLDEAVSVGERLAAPLVAAVLRSIGVDAIPVDATELVVTDGDHGHASVDGAATVERIDERLSAHLRAGRVPIVTGFLGATRTGTVTTLGRGGSDLTATLLGAALEAERIEFFKDVDGVLAADPRLVGDAPTVPALTYDEMAELARLGASVLHPSTIDPIRDRRIQIVVRRAALASECATTVDVCASGASGPKAIVVTDECRLVRITSRGLAAEHTLVQRALGAVERCGGARHTSTRSTAVGLVCLLVTETATTAGIVAELRREFERELALDAIDVVEGTDEIVFAAVVGDRIAENLTAASSLLAAVEDESVRVRDIGFGPTSCSLQLVISGGSARTVARRLLACIAPRSQAAEAAGVV